MDGWRLSNESTDSSRPNAILAGQDDQSAEDFPLKGNGWADFYTISGLDVNRPTFRESSSARGGNGKL
jgi:hypothetical protein